MIGVELQKLVRRPRTWVAVGLLCLLPTIVAVFLATTRISPPPGQGAAFLSAVLQSGSLYPAAALALVLPIFLPVAVAVIAGDSVAGESSQGTLRYLLVRPVRRTSLLVAKLVAVVVFVVGSVLAVAGSSYVVGVSLFGAGDPVAVVRALPEVTGGDDAVAGTGPEAAPAGGQVGGSAAASGGQAQRPGADTGDATAVDPDAARERAQASVSSLSGEALSPADLAARLLGAMGYVTVSMLGVAAIALFLSTITTSSLGATLGALAALITSQVLVSLDAAASVTPYLPTRYWLAWVDFFRDPIFLRDITAGLWLQAGYVVVLMLAAWANFTTKDVTS
ncbi:ABC-2 type transport system permease protein [Actinomycetospora succinea]|uniref:ABC-2 type transport system permease protein n=1 Tax=Actinomycetospora succinea TaxID=663603 RepID=A0A4R6UVU6_9PSEU|nr:ABC transporter permease [Actinomycetospora succinea]TDQ50089.1 ABC-2 type transport system permease protein [Actinomycetospora succinea]